MTQLSTIRNRMRSLHLADEQTVLAAMVDQYGLDQETRRGKFQHMPQNSSPRSECAEIPVLWRFFWPNTVFPPKKVWP